MPARDDRRRRRLGVFLVMLSMSFVGLAGLMSSASAAPVAPNSPQTTTTPPKSVPITLNLLGIKIHLTLPTLNGILQLGAPSSSPPASSSTPPPTSSSPPPPTSSSPKPSTSTRTQVVPPPAEFVGGPTHTAAPPPSSSTSSPTPTKTKTAKPPAPRVETVGTFLHNLLPTSLARLLYLVTLVAAIGIAVGIMRLGRRGSH